jgi:flagellar biosynthetic protein FliO
VNFFLGAAALPDVGASIARMLGGLAFVLALFFGGIWILKNWQRVARTRTRSRLRLIETQALGQRQALHVIGYAEQRFLVAASPGNVSLLSVLPAAAECDAAETAPASPASFAWLLQNTLGRK